MNIQGLVSLAYFVAKKFHFDNNAVEVLYTYLYNHSIISLIGRQLTSKK